MIDFSNINEFQKIVNIFQIFDIITLIIFAKTIMLIFKYNNNNRIYN